MGVGVILVYKDIIITGISDNAPYQLSLPYSHTCFIRFNPPSHLRCTPHLMNVRTQTGASATARGVNNYNYNDDDDGDDDDDPVRRQWANHMLRSQVGYLLHKIHANTSSYARFKAYAPHLDTPSLHIGPSSSPQWKQTIT